MKIITRIRAFLYSSYLSLLWLGRKEETSTVEVNGQTLFYAMLGPVDGRPVVLLHGNGGSHKSMLTQARELAGRGYRVYSPDSRGQGANAPLDEYHYADMAEDSFRFIRALGLDKPAVFGWSDGGILILMMEIAHPGTCGPSVVAGANLWPDCGDSFEAFKSWILEQDTPLTRMMLNEPDIRPEDLRRITCPVLVAVGEKDLISLEHTRIISDNIPGSELAVFPGASHSSYIKKSPAIGRRMLEFFRKHSYIAAVLSAVSFPSYAQDAGGGPGADSIIGEYLVPNPKNGDAKVRFTKNGEGTYDCQIIWLQFPDDPSTGKPWLDYKNRNKSLRGRRIIGLYIIEGLKYNDEKKQWDGSKVYVPRRGFKANFTCTITPSGDLKVKGSLFGIEESYDWIRQRLTLL